MSSRLFANYSYNAWMERHTGKVVGVSSLIGSFAGAYENSHPKHGSVRLRDAVFGGMIGGMLGAVSGVIIAGLHPMMVLAPFAVVPYAYNKSTEVTQKQHMAIEAISKRN